MCPDIACARLVTTLVFGVVIGLPVIIGLAAAYRERRQAGRRYEHH